MLDAAGLGRAVRLFRSEGTSTTYLGEFTLADPPSYNADAPAGEVMGTGQAHHVPEELADVLIYRLCLADVLNVDLGAVVADKLAKNGCWYTVESSFGNAEKH